MELKLCSKALGPEHPDTLTSMASLAHILYSQENIHKALMLMEDCVKLRGKLLGHSHPHTRNSARSLKDWKEMAELSNIQHRSRVQTETTQSMKGITQHSCSHDLATTKADENKEAPRSVQGVRPATPLRAFLGTYPFPLASRDNSSKMRHDLHEVD
ncbi:hypothetical protein BJX65DRAFT_288377 [Aspergillus insuetus]